MPTDKPSSMLDQTMAMNLLDKLSSDDAYRDRFSNNPYGALQEIGYTESVHAAACLSKMSGLPLASKEQLAASKAELMSTLTASLGQHPHVLASFTPEGE